jgi:hypothetical protein
VVVPGEPVPALHAGHLDRLPVSNVVHLTPWRRERVVRRRNEHVRRRNEHGRTGVIPAVDLFQLG